jgi:DNA-binding Lrp family transcriptional regulator
MKKKKKKWTDAHPIGHFNKSRILNLLKQDWRNGLKQNEIIEKTDLSKPTISRILQELLSEHKIFKLNNLYFPEFDDDFIFGYFLSDYVNVSLTKILEKKKTISDLIDTPYKSKLIDKDPIDNSVFEFANVMGGLITYILIEGSSLYADDRESAKIKELIDNIFKGISWNNIFYQFGNLFRDSCEDKETRNHEKGFNMLSKSLKNVYPRLYETLEIKRIKFFKEWIQDNPDTNFYKNCDHEWKEHYLFKCGKFEECVHCRYQRLK